MRVWAPGQGAEPSARVGYAFLVSIPAAISATNPITVPSTNTIASLRLVTASKIPIGPPAPMTAAPVSPAGMNENHDSFPWSTMRKAAIPRNTHSNCIWPLTSDVISAAATQNIPPRPATAARFTPLIFPPAAMKQAQPSTPTYHNMLITAATFTNTATITPILSAKANTMSICLSLLGRQGSSEQAAWSGEMVLVRQRKAERRYGRYGSLSSSATRRFPSVLLDVNVRLLRGAP